MREQLIGFRGSRSQSEMAKRYKISQQAWSKWEQGTACPSPAIMLQLEKDSGIPMEVLFFDSFNNHIELEEAVL